MSMSSKLSQGTWSRFQSPLVAVPIIGMVYTELFYITWSIFFFSYLGSLPFFVIFWAPFMILMPISIITIWRKPRVGYPLAAVTAAVALALFADGGHGVEVYYTPASTGQFIDVITNLPAYFAVLLYSALGFLNMRHKPSVEPVKTSRMIPRYSIASTLILGFIIGGLVIGLMAGATESRLLQNGTGDIVIVSGAANQNNVQFYNPSVFQAKVGQTVTWSNRDSAAHTVTSDTGAFDSQNLDVGASYQFTFTQTGNYTYHCTYHTWMTGKVTVTS